MDKNKAYCQLCNEEMKFDGKEQKFNYNCECYKYINRKRILLWCESCQKFTSRQGTYKLAKCARCAVIAQHKTMKEQDPEGYAKRQSTASNKAHKSMKENGTGIYNPEVREKIEKTKNKNGFYERLNKSSIEWRKNNPERAKKIAINGGKATAERIKNMSKDDKIKWVERSCNNEESNRKKNLSKSKNTKIKYCEICKIYTFHLNGMCTKCHPSSGTGRKYALASNFQQNFIIKNNVRFYKGIEVNELIKQLYNNEIEIPLGFNKSFGEWYYNTENILTGEITKFNNSSFEEKESQLYYYDKVLKDYILWEDYKIKFSRKRVTKDISLFIEKLKTIETFKYENIQVIPTFRTKESENWTGSKNAFEQSLADMNINWFTYVKFYIDKNQVVRPFVVGKTGSLLVNSSGSDVSFSTDINDVPARRFLNEINRNWDKTQILIIPAKSEKQSYFFEYQIVKIFDLFES